MNLYSVHSIPGVPGILRTKKRYKRYGRIKRVRFPPFVKGNKEYETCRICDWKSFRTKKRKYTGCTVCYNIVYLIIVVYMCDIDMCDIDMCETIT